MFQNLPGAGSWQGALDVLFASLLIALVVTRILLILHSRSKAAKKDAVRELDLPEKTVEPKPRLICLKSNWSQGVFVQQLHGEKSIQMKETGRHSRQSATDGQHSVIRFDKDTDTYRFCLAFLADANYHQSVLRTWGGSDVPNMVVRFNSSICKECQVSETKDGEVCREFPISVTAGSNILYLTLANMPDFILGPIHVVLR
mmetsp:Transcript_114756/g.272953  ORF Transcript_114756/g.272953 Transcript_114756/m.272953 type:complete len:201 (-) Transcript_114756:142-744(-)